MAPKENKKTDAEIKQEEQRKQENKDIFEMLSRKQKDTARITHKSPETSGLGDCEAHRRRKRGWGYPRSKVAGRGLIWYVRETNRDPNEDTEISSTSQRHLGKTLEEGRTDIT